MNVYCFRSKHRHQIIVPPGTDFLFPCVVTIHGEGPFEFGMDLYFADPDFRTVPVTVRGVGIAPRESKNDKPPS